MTKEKIIINEQNYEGYKELHNVNSKMSNAEYRNNINVLKKSFITFFIGMIIIAITSLFYGSGLIVKGILISELVTLLIVVGGLSVDYLIKVFALKKEKNKDVKEMYPYVDTDVDLYELEKSLNDYETNKFLKEKDVNFEEYKNVENDKVIDDGNICFENIDRNEYYDCSINQQCDDSFVNDENQKCKNKVKTLIK